MIAVYLDLICSYFRTEVGQEESLLRQWLDVGITESGKEHRWEFIMSRENHSWSLRNGLFTILQ